MSPKSNAFNVIFVCTGNICRSPMAEVVFRSLVIKAGYGDRVFSSSAGTGDWHVGERADTRTIAALGKRGYDGAAHRAKQFKAKHFQENDIIVALDRSHERILQSWAKDESEYERVSLLMSYTSSANHGVDVYDPYYGNEEQFDEVLTMIEEGVSALFGQLEPALRSSTVTEEQEVIAPIE